MISSAVHPDAIIIWGVALDEKLNDEMYVTVIATGFDGTASESTNAFGAAVTSSANAVDDADLIDVLGIFEKKNH